jgi:hypothetical protein
MNENIKKNIEMQPIRSNANLSFESTNPTSSTFKGKKLTKSHVLTNKLLFKKRDKELDEPSITKSLEAMCSGVVPNTRKEEEMTHVVYIPVTINTPANLIASLPRANYFADEEYTKLPINEVKYRIIKGIINIPSTRQNLEQRVRKGLELFDLHQLNNKPQQPKKSSIEDNKPDNIELKVWESSFIYVKNYYHQLASEIYNLTHQCGGSMCIESNVNLLNMYQISELKKNIDMLAVLETKSVNKKYNFSIYVNPIIKGLKVNVYLNFFNIPEQDLKHILKHPDVESLQLVSSF